MKSIVVLFLLTGLASAQDVQPTYADVIAARRSGHVDPRTVRQETRRLAMIAGSNVVVEVTDPTGGVRLVNTTLCMMPGARSVHSNVTARSQYYAQRDRMLRALAQSVGDDDCILTAQCVTAEAYLAAASVASNHADRITSGTDVLSQVSPAGAAGWAGAAGVAGAALMAAWKRRKDTK